MQLEEATKLLAGLGLGTGTGAVITALINSHSSKGKARAEAADLLVTAAERVGKFNKELDRENKKLRRDVTHLQLLILQFLEKEITEQEFIDGFKSFKD